MTFSITLFVISWIFFFIFADKKSFFSISPTCYLAMYSASIFSMITKVYPFWTYPAPNKVLEILRDLLHDFSLYPITTYFFLQTLPKKQTFYTIALHIFYWTIPATIIECIAIKTGNMIYGLGWNLWRSYFMDWILYGIFYAHHKWSDHGTKK